MRRRQAGSSSALGRSSNARDISNVQSDTGEQEEVDNTAAQILQQASAVGSSSDHVRRDVTNDTLARDVRRRNISYGEVDSEEDSDEPDGDYDPDADHDVSDKVEDGNENTQAIWTLDADIDEVKLSGRKIMDVVWNGVRDKGTI